MNYVEHLDLFGVKAKEIPCIKGSSAPTKSTVGAVGLLYMNTSTGDIYKCTAVSEGSYTWKSLGGSGGVSSWNDLTDKPFYEEITDVTFIDNESVPGMYINESCPYEFIEGQTYTVSIDGIEYSCVAYTMTEDRLSISMIGNGEIAGLTGGNNEPFYGCIIMGAFLFGIYDNSTHTVTITGPVHIVHELEEKFIPYIAGRNVSGQTFTVDGEEVVAGEFAETFNFDNIATGMCSHAEGGGTIASGLCSHAEGCETIASGDQSHAEGYYTIAASDYQHVQGSYNIEDSENKYAHIVGNGESDTARSNAHTLDWEGNAWFAGDVYVGGSGQDDTAAQKLATEAYVNEHAGSGSSSGTGVSSWNDLTDRPFYEEISEVTMLDNVTMDCLRSTRYIIPDFPYEFIEGSTYTVTVNGTEYSCVAYMITADGINVPAIGNSTLVGGADGNNEPFIACAMAGMEFIFYVSVPGTYTVTITGPISIIHELDEKFIPYIAGRNVSGQTFTVDGEEVVADIFAETFNFNNIATGIDSHAEGCYTIASGDFSHAEGWETTASGNYSHAECFETTASGDGSHAEGNGTIASGDFSHAEGKNTIASGLFSHAEGYYTIAADYQHTQGKYNIEDSAGTYAHIVGNGTDSTRSNAHTLDWEGNAWFAGDVYVGGSGQDDTAAEKLPTEARVAEMINAAIAAISPAEGVSF